MTERYDSTTATHYAAYRPPLHRLILERAIDESESFESGLDFGCGTGRSAVALAEYCDQVCGVDLSRQMLALAKPHPRITYMSGTIESLGRLPGRPYDVVTFAGSLFYVKSEALRGALISACKPAGTVIIYDFNVRLDPLMARAGLEASAVASEYDYAMGLADWDELEAVAGESDRLRISVSPEQAAHLLLSDSARHDAIQAALGREDAFGPLAARFRQSKDAINLVADICFKRYHLAHSDRKPKKPERAMPGGMPAHGGSS